VSLYRDDAVVLRQQKLGEADRIVTLLTRRHGRIRAVAKGARRTKSRFGARLELASHVDVQLYSGRNLDIVTQVETLSPFGAELAADYPRYTTATAVLETAERLAAEEGEPSLRLYLLTVGALRTLAERESERRHEAGLVLDAFLIRAMAVAGWEPALGDCAKCGEPGPHRAFSIQMGGAVCNACRPAAVATPRLETVHLMRALLVGDWPAAEGCEPAARREASGLIAAHLQWHLERGLRSLPLVERA
jgi:DNA repair protein RecO (recombination protein O)